MKKQLTSSLVAAAVVIASGTLATAAFARDSLIDMDNARSGGFGGPVFKTSKIKGQQTFEIGGVGGATFTSDKHSVMLGGGGFGLVNELPWNTNDKLEMGYGGFILGYTYNPEALVHVDSQLLLGGGGVTVLNADNSAGDSGSFLIAELSSQVEINVTDFMELAIGASYRLASDPSIENLSSGDLSNPTMFISFQFGSL